MSLFEAGPAAKEILKNAQLMLRENSALRVALTNQDRKYLFEESLSGIWISYHHQRYLKPIANYPTQKQINSAVAIIHQSYDLLKTIHVKFPRVNVANRAKIESTTSHLEEMLSIFRSAESRQRSTGRGVNDPLVAQAVKGAIQAIMSATGSDFPVTSDYANGRGEKVFENENVEFLYQLINGVDADIGRSMVATALRKVPKNFLQKPPSTLCT